MPGKSAKVELRVNRYRRRLAACLVLLFGGWAGQSLWAVPNPVIPRLADCGVMHYQGRYYISGTWMGDKMRVSDDLVHWTDPVHVFSMRNDWTDTTNNSDRSIHACDMTYDNGLFHFYWSVNHFPLRQIGHALATQPTYHLRVVKRGGHVSISIDAAQVGELPDAWRAAQVGLLAQQTEALFNDITRFHLRGPDAGSPK